MSICKNKTRLLSFILVGISIITIAVLLLFPVKVDKAVDHADGLLTKIELGKNDELEYTFISKVHSIYDLQLYIQNENKECSVDVSVYNNNYLIKETKIKDTKNESLISLKLKEIEDSYDKDYTMKIKNNCKKHAYIFMYKNDNEVVMKYNDEIIGASVYVREVTKVNSYTYLWYPIMILLIGLLIYVMSDNEEVNIANAKKNKRKK